MKVLYIIDSLQTGGAETSLLEISSRLRDFSPTICVLYNKKADLRSRFLGLGIPVIEMNITSRLWWIEGVRKLKNIVAEVKPDVVHATLFKSEVITRIALLRSEIPHIGSFVNDSYSPNRYAQQSFIRNAKLNFVRVVDLITARWVSHFMSITETIAASNAKALLLNEKRITCIYRGRSIGNFRVFHPTVEQQPFVFLTVARLLKRKGYLELFDAAKILHDKGYNFLLRIAGEGGDYSLFKKTIIKLCIVDKIEFLLTRTDVPELLAQSHCFVFPSHYEGQGGALVEAMLAAKPIVASDIPVFREQIEHNKTGKLFELFNARDLAASMEWMMTHYSEAITLGLNARTVAIERFNIERTVQLHDELYTKVLMTRNKA